MASSKGRKYDIILLGATGYTGKLCAEYITGNLPTDIKWAIAGRSQPKLEALVSDLKTQDQDRSPPAIEIANLNLEELSELASLTNLIINTVGPYHLYSSPVVAACAQAGTHYLDVTGESPWVLEMTHAHHETAKANKAIMISQVGLESTPSDILVWLLVDKLRHENPKTVAKTGVNQVTSAVHEAKYLPSGGSLATMFAMMESYSPKALAQETKWSHSPVPYHNDKPTRPASLLSRLTTSLFGVRNLPGLGLVIPSILMSTPNIATVQRTWGLLDAGAFYGPHFSYAEYMSSTSILTGTPLYWAMNVLVIVLSLLTPVRWLLKKLLWAPGSGPGKEAAAADVHEQSAVAVVIGDDGREKKGMSRFRYEGDIYYLTALFISEAAVCIVKGERTAEDLGGGGMLTPACLGQPFVDRLRKAGCFIECEVAS